MKEILGTVYISEKEAAFRYGYSASWFKLCRYKNTGPKFFKLRGKGKTWYPLKETDEWFKKNLEEN